MNIHNLTVVFSHKLAKDTQERLKYITTIFAQFMGVNLRLVSDLKFDDPDKVADIYYGSTPVHNAKIFIFMSDTEWDRQIMPSKIYEENGIKWCAWPGTERKGIVIRDKTVEIWSDIFRSSYLLISGWYEDFCRKSVEGWLRFPSNFLFDSDFFKSPLINDYLLKLKEYLGIAEDRQLALYPDCKKYAVCLTHDVDYPDIIRWIEAGRMFLRSPNRYLSRLKRVLTGYSDNWNFGRYFDLESGVNVRSTFFFCAVKGSLLRYLMGTRDPFYDINEKRFVDIMEFMKNGGWEVGLHASVHAYKSIDNLLSEKYSLEAAAKSRIKGNRHHYWMLGKGDIFNTLSLHEKAALIYDTSLAFEHEFGFRRAAGFPFFSHSPQSMETLKVTLQLPSVLMDSHLMIYKNLKYPHSFERIIPFLKSIKKSNALAVIDWHEYVWNEDIFPGWGNTYRDIVTYLNNDKDCLIITLDKFAEHWNKRIERLSLAFLN